MNKHTMKEKIEICIGIEDLGLMAVVQRAAIEFMQAYSDKYEIKVIYRNCIDCVIEYYGGRVLAYFAGVIYYYGQQYNLDKQKYTYILMMKDSSGYNLPADQEDFGKLAYIFDQYIPEYDGVEYIIGVRDGGEEKPPIKI